MRILRPSEQRPGPPRPCAVCGVVFRPNMKAVWSGKGKTCSPLCRSIYGSQTSRKGWACPPAELAQKLQAKAVIGKLLREGKLVRPDACTKCGASACRIEGHHPDYSKPGDVVWLCTKCHAAEHRQGVAA